MISPELEDRIRNTDIKLPTLDVVANRLIELLNDEEDDIKVKDFISLANKDMAISIKILQFINSPVSGLKVEITSIEHAIRLGSFKAIVTIALTFKLADIYAKYQPKVINYTHYWQRSILSAMAARQLAGKVLGDQQASAYMAALLQDTGILVFDQLYGVDYANTIRGFEKSSHLALAQVESRTYDHNHAAVGAYILQSWHIPTIICDAVANSHNMQQASESRFNDCVAVSGWVADIWLYGQEHSESRILAQGISHRLLSLDEQQVRDIIHAVNVELSEEARLLPNTKLTPLNEEKQARIAALAQQLLLAQIQTSHPQQAE